MPRDKTANHHKIMEAAKEEFMEKGYEKASMRAAASLAKTWPSASSALWMREMTTNLSMISKVSGHRLYSGTV